MNLFDFFERLDQLQRPADGVMPLVITPDDVEAVRAWVKDGPLWLWTGATVDEQWLRPANGVPPVAAASQPIEVPPEQILVAIPELAASVPRISLTPGSWAPSVIARLPIKRMRVAEWNFRHTPLRWWTLHPTQPIAHLWMASRVVPLRFA